MSFIWRPDTPPPQIEQHSKAKLKVLRQYLSAYFDRLGANPAREEFRLDLVDGFSGGGAFLDGDNVEPGTPIVMLEEANAAEARLNLNRNKRLKFNCKFHFVDVEPNHTNHLRRVLVERGYNIDGDQIIVHDAPFEVVTDSIIADILRRQPRVGRAIFLLDQCGFSRVSMELVARIFNKLPAAEVILTFAADTLVNHLSTIPAFAKAVAPISLTDSHIQEMIQYKDGAGGRALVQRVIREHIRSITGATYDTPFFIRPSQSRRALWFLHLSRHPIARDVMIQCHWNNFNTFEHYGTGDFNMLGWDALNTGTLPMFHFEDLEADQLREQLLNSMPAELHTLAADNPITVDAMRHRLANKTAARFSDLESIVLRLALEREIDILTSEGRKRSRHIKRLNSTDLISIPETLLLPGFSLRTQP